jgi:hypothetical protein
MASHANAVRSSSLPATERPPSTFQEALKAGWAVITDKSAQSINQKRREGKLTMQKPGCAGLLEVDYIGSRKGYRFSVPRFAYWKIPPKIVN